MPFVTTDTRTKITLTLATAQFNAMVAHVQRRGGSMAYYIRELVARDLPAEEAGEGGR